VDSGLHHTKLTIKTKQYPKQKQYMAHLNYKSFTLGVEEEYMVLDPATHELKSHEQRIVQEGESGNAPGRSGSGYRHLPKY
jgi:hypothetical protein